MFRYFQSLNLKNIGSVLDESDYEFPSAKLGERRDVCDSPTSQTSKKASMAGSSSTTPDGSSIHIFGIATDAKGNDWKHISLPDLSQSSSAVVRIKSFLQTIYGEYCGIIRSPTKRRTYLFASRVGVRPIFYSITKLGVVSSDHLLEVSRLRRHVEGSIKPSRKGFESYLYQGGMIDSCTLVEDIFRVQPGQLHELTDGSTSVRCHTYHRWRCNGNLTDREDSLDALQESFLAATKRQHGHFLESRPHLCSMSGGLDSRMAAMAAMRLGFKPRSFLSFGESASDDIMIASEIASHFQQEHLVIGLSGGEFISRVFDLACLAGGGVSTVAGAVHAVYATTRLCPAKSTRLHTGQLGDAAMGSFLVSSHHVRPKANLGRMFGRTCPEFDQRMNTIAEQYETHESYMFYTRGFMIANGGLAHLSPWLECKSPFLDERFLDAALNVSPDLRFGARLYKAWIKRDWPEVDRFRWEKTGGRPTALTIRGKSLPKLAVKITTKMFGLKRQQTKQMNPFDYWFDHNEHFRSWLTKSLETDFRDSFVHSEKLADPADCYQGVMSARERLHLLSLLKLERMIGEV